MDEQLYLTDDERSHFHTWEQLFQSEGWELLAKEMAAELDGGPGQLFMTAQSWDQVLEGRARIKAIMQLMTYPAIIEQRKQHIMAVRQQEAEERRISGARDY